MRYLVAILLIALGAVACQARGGITVASGVSACLFTATANVDGCANAPAVGATGASVYVTRATAFGSCNNGASTDNYTCPSSGQWTGGSWIRFRNGYTILPNWNIAAVDYPVGLPSGQKVKDPSGGLCATSTAPAGMCDSSGTYVMPTDCSWSGPVGSGAISCGLNGNACPVFDGLDLSVNGGTYINFQGSAGCVGTIHISHVFYKVGSPSVAQGNPISIDNRAGPGTPDLNIVLEYSYFDFVGQGQPASATVINPRGVIDAPYGGNGTFTSRYNAYRNNAGTRIFNAGLMSVVSQFDYSEGSNYNNIATHGELWYWGGGGTTAKWQMLYSTNYTDETNSGGGSTSWMYVAPGSSGNHMNLLEIDHSTWVMNPTKITGSVNTSSVFTITSFGGTGPNAIYGFTNGGKLRQKGVASIDFSYVNQLTDTSGYPANGGGNTGTYTINFYGTPANRTGDWYLPAAGGGMFWLGGSPGSNTWGSIKVTNNFFDASSFGGCFTNYNSLTVASGNIGSWTVTANTDMTDGSTSLSNADGLYQPTGCPSALP